MPRRPLPPPPAPSPQAQPNPGLPSHLQRPSASAFPTPQQRTAYPEHMAYFDALPPDHPDRANLLSATSSLSGQEWLAKNPPPAAPTDVAMFDWSGRGGVPAQPQTMSPTSAVSVPGQAPSGLAKLREFGDVLATRADAGLMRSGRAMGAAVGMPLDALARDEAMQDQYTEKFGSMIAPNPVAQNIADFGGAASEIVGGTLPYMNPATGALTGGGQAIRDQKSGFGVVTNAALGAVPGGLTGMAGRGLQALTRAPAVVANPIAAAGLGAGMVGAQAAETQFVEGRPELAQQELGALAPTAGAMGALELLATLATRRAVPKGPAPMAGAARGEFAPIEGGPAPGASPFQQDLAAPGMYGDGPGQSPFGGEFQTAPRPDITPEMRASTVTADPVLTGPDGRPALPDVRRGEFVPTATQRQVDADGFPLGQPGRYVATPEALTGPGPSPNRPAPAGLPPQFASDAATQPGFRMMDPAPAEFQGFYRAEPRPQDVQPQFRDPTSVGEAPIRGLDEYRMANAETVAGPDALMPVEYPDAYTMQPRRPGERMEMARSEAAPGDPYAETFRQSRARPDEQLDPMDPMDARQYEAGELSRMARMDTSVPETEVDLRAVSRADAPTEVVEPVRSDIRPEPASATTRVDVPTAEPLAHLSPQARAFVKTLKPGERDLIRRDIEALRRNPDPQGDLGNLQMTIEGARARAAKAKPGARGFKPLDRGTPDPKAAPLAAGEGKTSSRAEADLVQGGFRRRGDANPPEKVDVEAETRLDLPPVKEGPAPDSGNSRADRGSEGPRPEGTEGVKYSGLPPELLAPFKGIAQAVGRGAKWALDTWSKRLYRVVGDMPGGKAAAAKAQKAIDRTRQLQGQFDGDRNRFLKEVRGSKKAREVRASLAEVDWDGDAGFARINDVLDGETPPRPNEQAAVNAYRRAFLDTGKAAEAANYQIAVGTRMEKFTADPKRQRAPRIGTRDLYWYASHPKDADTKRLATLIAEYNPGMSEDDVMRELAFWSERGSTKRGMAEDARTIEHFPTHYRTKDGDVVQLLENDPQVIIDAVTRRFPARIAYVEQFGQGGTPKELQELADASGEGGKEAAQNLFRALNGMPLEQPGLAGYDAARPGSPEAVTLRALEVPWTLWKGLKLSMAPLANIPETIGKARAITGTGARVDKFIKAGFDVSFLNRNSDAVIDDLANRGALTRDMMDWYYNAYNKPETLNRYVLNTTGAVNQMVNEFNEKLAARLASGWADSLKAGKGGIVDKFRLRVLDFNPGEIDAILSGKAPKQTYNTVMARAVEWSQGSTSQAAERSRAGGSRIWNLITVADRFAQMNMNRNFDALAKVAKTLTDPKSTWKDRVGAAAFALDLLPSQVAAASITLAMRAIVVGGAGVLADKALGSPAGLADFLIDAARYALLGAPVDAVLNVGTGEDPTVAESLARPLLPISTIQEMRNMLVGEGRYEGMGALESAREFLTAGTPASGAVANIAAVSGFREDDRELDAAISAYWKWRKKYAPAPSITGGEADATGFRAAMRKAAYSMRDGVDPSEAVSEALQAGGDPKKIRRSLLSRRLLSGLKPAQQGEMQEYLGENTVARLRQYDALLTAWANAISPVRD